MAEIKSLSSKMRLRFFQETGELLSDRLVEQNTEFMMGPKETHKGPVQLEVTLRTQEEVDNFIAYVKKVKGDLPIVAKEKKNAPKQIDKMLSEKEPLLDLVKTLQAKSKTQEQLIAALREYDFKFMMSDTVKDLGGIKEQITLRDKDEDYQFMVRLVKEAKDPMNDKYDFRLALGIKIIGEKVDRVKIYIWGKYDTYWKLPWEKAKANNFKKVEPLHVFPKFMDYEDRKKWRKEHRMVVNAKATNDKYEPTKFYNKWAPHITIH